MKKILIVIDSFNIGGAQKSLISLLRLLPKDTFIIDVMPLTANCVLESYIPEDVTLVPPSKKINSMLTSPLSFGFWRRKYVVDWIKQIMCYSTIKIRKSFSRDQIIWKFWKSSIPEMSTQYDVAIGYLQGLSSYFVIDKVDAFKKVLWVHTDYSAIKKDVEFNRL